MTIEHAHVPKGNVLKRKVGGVPVIYLAGGTALVLAVYAYRAKATAKDSPADTTDTNPAQTDAETDVANASGSSADVYPNMPTGTVIVAPQGASTPEPTYEDNDTWLRKSVAYLIAHGENPGNAQVALQTYLSGNDLSVAQGAMRDKVVKEYGLPPETFTSGNTAVPPPKVVPKATTPATTPPKPVPAKPIPPKPAPPKVTTYVVRSGDTLSGIAGKYRTTWQALYAKNRAVIGSNPNLIKPGQRLVVS